MVLWRSRAAPPEPAPDAADSAAASSGMADDGDGDNDTTNRHHHDDRTPSPEVTDSASDEGGAGAAVMDMAALDEAAASLGSASDFCARNGLTDCGPASTSLPFDDYDGGGLGGMPPQQRQGALGGLMGGMDPGGGFPHDDAGGPPPLFPSLTAGGVGVGVGLGGVGAHLQPPLNYPHHGPSSGIWPPPQQENSKKMKRDRSGNAAGGVGERNVTRIDVYPNGESYVTTPDGTTTKSVAGGLQSSSAPAPASPIFQFTSNTAAATTSLGLGGGLGGEGSRHSPGNSSRGSAMVTPQTAAAALNFGKGFAPGAGAQGIHAPLTSSVGVPLDNNSNNSSSLVGGDDDPPPVGPLDPDDGGDSSTSGALVPHWQPQNQTSTCEFTHTISNYSHKRDSGCKKAEYSGITTDSHGNKWRLIIYVNGNGRASNHHLSLFLQVADAEELPFGWNKAVSYVLTLEHPQGQSLGYAKRNPDKTFKLCPKAIDWGWSQFITSDRIQQEGYVHKNTLTVRASVTVKSSSVQIDPEDAELYLKCAVEEGNADAVKVCLGQEARVNCQFKDDLYTPLHTACSANGNGEGGDRGGSSSSSTPTNSSSSAAPGPIPPGSLEVLDLLLERGGDVNACNKWRETPLLIAANNGHVEAVKRLLLSGADPGLCSEAGWSALTFAAHKGYEEICGLLLAARAPVNCRVTEDLSTPLHKACAGSKAGHVSAVRQLLEGNADVHALNKWRETPLLTAANHGQGQAVEALLRYGADPCKCTDTGWSPLSIAAYKGHDEVVRLLLEEGAPTEEDDPTLSALLQAATKGLPDTVMLLLRHGADHTVTTKKGDTALSILVEQNLIDAAVEMVTDYSASVPRCSRDRKKVQRARLLINLRLKQMQREGTGPYCDDSDHGESDGASSDSVDGSYRGGRALHDDAYDDDFSGAASPLASRSKRKKKTKQGQPQNSIAQAEANARAAEEALLLELEAEENAKSAKKAAQAESGGSKNSKKKRKKKEKERQLKQAERAREEAELQKKERELQKAKEEAQAAKQPQQNTSPPKKEKVVELTSQTVIQTQKQKKRQDNIASPPANKKAGQNREPPSVQNKKQGAGETKLNLKWAEGKEAKPKKAREVSLPKPDQASSSTKKSASATSNNHVHRTKSNNHLARGAGGNKKIPGDNPIPKKIPGDNPIQPRKIPGDNPVVPRKIPGDNPIPKKIPGDNPKIPVQQQLRGQNVRGGGGSTPKNKRGWENKGPAQQPSSSIPMANQKKQTKQSNKKKANGGATAMPTAVVNKSLPISSRDSISPSAKGKSTARSDESTHSTANSTADSLPPTPTPQKGALPNNAVAGAAVSAATPEKIPMPSNVGVGPKDSVDDQLANMANDVLGFLDFDSSSSSQPRNNEVHQTLDVHGYSVGGQSAISSITPPPTNTQMVSASATLPSPPTAAATAAAPPLVSAISVELPSVSIYRLEKLNGLFRQCSEARSNPNDPLRVIDERTLRVVLYRWIIRASHGTESFLDPVIPSWEDEAYLKEFLQRQFISESRRSASSAEDSQQRYNIPSIEVLRDAGAAMSEICTSLAKDVIEFRTKCEQQVPSDWSDTHINVAGMEEGSNVVIDWSGKSRLSIPFVVFNSLARRYVGDRNRLMSAVFSAVRRHEIMGAIADQTDMICHLPLQSMECLTKGLGASLETWSDSVSVYGNNYFCAMFPDVDTAFGGLPPFGKEKGGGESVLNRAGGSVIVLAPPENATASQCIRKMVDMSETSANLPLSFGVVLTSDCFVNANAILSTEDLRALDPRLCGEKKSFISFVEVIPAGSSIFSKSSSMFLLIQNEAGKIRFPAHASSIDIIRRSMRSDIRMSNNAPMMSNLPGMQSNAPSQYDAASYSPVARPQYTEYGGAPQEMPLPSNPWGPGGGGVGGNRNRGHRGRLFELVGDEEAEEDQGMSNILPGMLDSLNMNMFGNIPNTNDEIDIEAISLMGIGLNGVNSTMKR